MAAFIGNLRKTSCVSYRIFTYHRNWCFSMNIRTIHRLVQPDITKMKNIRLSKSVLPVASNISNRINTGCSKFVLSMSMQSHLKTGWTPKLISLSGLNSYRRLHTLFTHQKFCKQSLLANHSVAGNNMQIRFVKVHPRTSAQRFQQRNKTVMIYILSLTILVGGLSYAAVPLYTLFCQATGLGGQATLGHDIDKVETMQKVDRLIKVRFNADTASSMRWNFKPQMTDVEVAVGETALAFYKAKNPTDKPIIGIATYNVVPFEAGQYFNKIQCFCFEEQILNPHEEVDMPVFFYIDPDFAEDPKMQNLDQMTLSYTFFEAKEGLDLPQPFTKQNIA
ncbi:cytochrome c oxidase assembly protein ctaG-like [Glandiceps talaboti]